MLDILHRLRRSPRPVLFFFNQRTTCISFHWRHSRRLMNADTLDGEASASLNAEASHYLLLAEQLPVRSAFLFSLFHLVFASVTFAVTFVFIHLKYLVAHHI